METDRAVATATGGAGVRRDAQGIAHVTIDAGGPLNIIGSATALAIASTLEGLARDPDVRVVVLRGTGEKTFVGGADVREMAGLEPESARRFIGALHRLCEAARDLPVPSLCVLPGWCIGVGLELAAACDLRVAADDARFVMPEVKLGIPSVIHAAFLSRLVGEGRARWLMLTGEAIDARTAEDWGLVNEVVPLDRLDAAVDHQARALAELSPAGLRAQKRVFRAGEAPHLDASMRQSIEVFGSAYESGDPERLMQAFLTRKSR
jgi:enoyl-CoA hydratase/carnithine racemase